MVEIQKQKGEMNQIVSRQINKLYKLLKKVQKRYQ